MNTRCQVSQRAFSRRVGASLQLAGHSQQLAAARSSISWRSPPRSASVASSFIKLGFISVGMDVSECLLPVATGFVLLNFELDLYPGARLSPVEELRTAHRFDHVHVRRVGHRCSRVPWLAHDADLVPNRRLPGLLVCVANRPHLDSPLARQIHKLGICPHLVCGDDAAAVRLYYWLVRQPSPRLTTGRCQSAIANR